ncbi:MAG: helix-turn-helix transcriptional regulator [Ruminococcaceae bacterium]|nr:helix-turn-helix transcriptional regulator [Oscillospiraceae bacterium]
MDVNERIRCLMEQRGWTPYRLAKESGLSDATIGNLFRRNTMPSIATLSAICRGFRITVAEFFGGDELASITPETRELLDSWNQLSAEQQTVLKQLIKCMIQK